MNRNHYKIIAILAMLMDHIAWVFLDKTTIPAQIMHGIGRLTFPIMAFFIVEGFHKTRDIKKYILHMALFYTISIIPFHISLKESMNLSAIKQNIFYSFTLSLILLYIVHSKWHNIAKIGLGIPIFMLCSFGDYSLFAPLLILAMDYYYLDKKKMILIGEAVLLLLIAGNNTSYAIYRYITLIPLPLLYFYNGKKGKTTPFSKYAFYAFYPLHLFLLGVLK